MTTLFIALGIALIVSLVYLIITLFKKNSDLIHLKNQVKTITARNDILLNENQELKNENNNLKSELKQYFETVSKLQIDKSVLEEKNSQLEVKQKEIINQNLKLTEENKVFSEKISILQKELSESLTELSETKKNNIQIKEFYEKTIKNLETEKQNLLQENKEISQRILKTEKDLSEAQTEISEIKKSGIQIKEYYNKTIENLETEKQIIAKENRELSEKIIRLEKELSELQTSIFEEKKNTKEKLELLQKARDELSEAFENLSNKILDQRLDKLEKTNFAGLKTVLEPLKIQIKDFKDRLENIGSQQIKEQGKLLNELQNLKDLNKRLSEEASNLTKALKGDKKLQGNWGEMRLKRIFENSGLQEGIEYELQKSISDNEGKRFIPDAVVHLPNQRDIIIDSKVSLVSYEKYFTTDNEIAKEKFLKEFLSAIKNHIKQLSEKSYEKLTGINSLDYVLMFIPIEAAYLTAIQKSMDIFDYAVKNGIMLVSPSTLLLALKTVNNLWKIEHQNRNIKEIVKRGEKMYNKFVSFIDELKVVGKHLDMAKRSYDNSYKLLTTGKGNLVSQAEKLISLGINPNKTLKNIDYSED